MTLDEEKKALRRRMRALRLVVDQKEGPDAGRGLTVNGLPRRGDLGIGAGTVVGGYWPIVTEIDVRPLLARLELEGAACALPVIAETGGPLVFRRWRLEDPLEEGPRATYHPLPSAPEVTPEVLFVPLLAFDAGGYRLGQGGGYYDRTLAALRARGPVTAVGVGYAIQQVDHVPHGPHDARLDWLLTENALTRASP